MGYEYYDKIKPPSAIGMSSKGSMNALTDNVEGLVDYVKLLVEGGGNASTTGRPLGNKYFLNTNAKCKDVHSKKEVDRYMYIDNQPQKGSSFIGGGMGINFTEFRGLLPGILDDMDQINPERIFDAFMEGSSPPCRSVELDTINDQGERSRETHHVPDEELKNLSACTFSNRTNPVTGSRCEGFTGSMRDMSSFGEGNIFELDDEIEEVFHQMNRSWVKTSMIGITGLFLLYLVWKMRKR